MPTYRPGRHFYFMKKSFGTVLLVAALTGALALFFTTASSLRTSRPLPASSLAVASVPSSPPIEKPVAANAPLPAATPTTGKATLTLKEIYKAFDLIDAATEADTPESLQALVTYAATTNADLRSASLDGLIRRGDNAAAPLLRKAAKELNDSDAIIALLQTASYLELPPADMTAIAATRTPAKRDKTQHKTAPVLPQSP